MRYVDSLIKQTLVRSLVVSSSLFGFLIDGRLQAQVESVVQETAQQEPTSQDQNLWEAIQGNEDWSMLAKALETAELTDALSGE